MADSIKEINRKLRYNTRKDLGVCTRCGVAPSLMGRCQCEACAEIAKTRAKHIQETRKKSGKCSSCGKLPLPGKLQCEACQQHANCHDRKTNIQARRDVYEAYGNQCVCCGESNPKLLTVDHMNNDGAQHRRDLKLKSGGAILSMVKATRLSNRISITVLEL